MIVWDFVNAINTSKQDLFVDPQADKDYVPFIVNKALSYFPDTVLYANAMNMVASTAPKRWQFDFLREAIPKRKRFSKWAKKDEVTADLVAVQEFYNYSTEKALEIMSILTKDQIKEITSAMSHGGRRGAAS